MALAKPDAGKTIAPSASSDLGEGFYVLLSQAYIDYADRVSRQRQENAKRYRRQPGLGLAPEDDLVNGEEYSERGCRGELSGAIWGSVYVGDRLVRPVWNKYREHGFYGTPDLDDWVDVKTTEVRRHKLLVNEAILKPNWAYLLICAESHPYYWIRGWCWGREIETLSGGNYRPPRSAKEGRGLLVDASVLHCPTALQTVFKERFLERNGG